MMSLSDYCSCRIACGMSTHISSSLWYSGDTPPLKFFDGLSRVLEVDKRSKMCLDLFPTQDYRFL